MRWTYCASSPASGALCWCFRPNGTLASRSPSRICGPKRRAPRCRPHRRSCHRRSVVGICQWTAWVEENTICRELVAYTLWNSEFQIHKGTHLSVPFSWVTWYSIGDNFFFSSFLSISTFGLKVGLINLLISLCDLSLKLSTPIG